MTLGADTRNALIDLTAPLGAAGNDGASSYNAGKAGAAEKLFDVGIRHTS